MVLHAVNHCENVYWFEASHPSTYGAVAYLLLHPEGSILIDVPVYSPETVRAIQTFGPLRYIFITHRDDIGPAAEFQNFFKARVILHRTEVRYYREGTVDLPFEGDFMLHPDIAIVHIPGHTPGSAALVDRRPPGVVFVGDAVNLDDAGELYVPPHPWDFDPVLKRYSLKKLLDFEFEVILPAHPPKPGEFLFQDGRLRLESLLKRLL